jgi:hypothetical protein
MRTANPTAATTSSSSSSVRSTNTCHLSHIRYGFVRRSHVEDLAAISESLPRRLGALNEITFVWRVSWLVDLSLRW